MSTNNDFSILKLPNVIFHYYVLIPNPNHGRRKMFLMGRLAAKDT